MNLYSIMSKPVMSLLVYNLNGERSRFHIRFDPFVSQSLCSFVPIEPSWVTMELQSLSVPPVSLNITLYNAIRGNLLSL